MALQGCHLRIKQEVVFWAARKGHGVAGDSGEIGEERLEAVDGQAVRGGFVAALRSAALSAGLATMEVRAAAAFALS